MPLNLNLINDSSQIDSINSITVMVAVPLLYVFMVIYIYHIDSLSFSSFVKTKK
jgi:hypothetical protein